MLFFVQWATSTSVEQPAADTDHEDATMIFASSTDDFAQAEPVSTTFAVDDVARTAAEVSHQDPRLTRLRVVPEPPRDHVVLQRSGRSS